MARGHISKDGLLAYLVNLSTKRIEMLEAVRRDLVKYSCLFDYRAMDETCNPYVAVVWELASRVGTFKDSANSYWQLRRGHMDEHAVLFEQWKALFVVDQSE